MYANSGGYGAYAPYGSYGPNSYNYGAGGYYGGNSGGYGTGVGYYGNRYGMGGMMGVSDPSNPHANVPGAHESLFSQMEQSTAATFALLENIVMAFTGFSQMLESTFHATHSSFMAMVGVADHFSNLKQYLGKMLGVLTLLRTMEDQFDYLKSWIGIPVKAKFVGDSLTKEFMHGKATPSGALGHRRTSRKPLFVFLLVMLGFPLLFHKLIDSVRRKHALALLQAQQSHSLGVISGPDGQPLTLASIPELEFARALHDFEPDPTNAENELSLKKGELIAILSKGRPSAANKDEISTDIIDSEWWRGRLQNGKMGWFPQNHVAILKKPAHLLSVQKKQSDQRQSLDVDAQGGFYERGTPVHVS